MPDEEGFRHNPRIREDIPVHWRIESSGRLGKGVIRNLSVTGALLESQSLSSPGKDVEFILEAVEPREEFLVPLRARFVWGKLAAAGKGYYFCGLEFVAPASTTVGAIEERIDHRLRDMSDGMNISVLDNYFARNES
jgi:hypothetical protein